MYIIADLVGPDLGIVDVVGFVGEVGTDDVIDLLLDEGPDVVEDCLLLLTHVTSQIKQ